MHRKNKYTSVFKEEPQIIDIIFSENIKLVEFPLAELYENYDYLGKI